MNNFLIFARDESMLFAILAALAVLYFINESRRGGKTISPNELTALVNKEDAVLLDIRDTKEFATGHIVNAINIPLAKLGERMAELERHRAHPIVIVDKFGQQSGGAGATLREAGFANVQRLSGGLAEWQASNLPLVTA